MPTFRRHVFVCINERAPGHPRGCCKSKGGEAVQTQLKRELTAHGLRDVVRANKAGCLDQCEQGVTMVVYPEQVWYGGVTPEDVPEIVSRHIIGGEYVARLMIPDQPHLKGQSQSPPIEPGPEPKGEDAAPSSEPER